MGFYPRIDRNGGRIKTEMKVIFDSQKQKEAFITELARYLCPEDFMLKGCGGKGICKSGTDCAICWKNSEIEMEVRENGDE